MLLLLRWFFSIVIYGRAPLKKVPVVYEPEPEHIHTFSKWKLKEFGIYHDNCSECGSQHDYECRAIYIRICSECADYELKQYKTKEYGLESNAKEALNKLIEIANASFESEQSPVEST